MKARHATVTKHTQDGVVSRDCLDSDTDVVIMSLYITTVDPK